MIRTAPSSILSCTTVAVSIALVWIAQVWTAPTTASGTSSQPSSCRRRLLSGMALLQKVTQPAQRDDRGVAVLQLPAQSGHVDLDGVRTRAVMHGEQALGQGLLAHRLAQLDDERFQDGMLARRKREILVAEREDAGIACVHQRARLT